MLSSEKEAKCVICLDSQATLGTALSILGVDPQTLFQKVGLRGGGEGAPATRSCSPLHLSEEQCGCLWGVGIEDSLC